MIPVTLLRRESAVTPPSAAILHRLCLVLGAEVDIVGATGVRRIPLQELYVEDGRAHLALADGELVAAIHLPADPPISSYAKVRVRGAIDYPLAGVAVALAPSGASIGSLRIALTGTNSRPFLLSGTDAFALRSVDDRLLQEIDRLVQKQVQPMRTTLDTANYRRVAAAALARRMTASLFAECTAQRLFRRLAAKRIGSRRRRTAPRFRTCRSLSWTGDDCRCLKFDLCRKCEKIVDEDHAHRGIVVSHQRLPDAAQFSPVGEVARFVDAERRDPADVGRLAAGLGENGQYILERLLELRNEQFAVELLFLGSHPT